MAKGPRPRRSKWVPHVPGQTLEQSIAAQYAANPGLEREVEQLMKQMEREAAA
jgi:hypothetical protein